MTKQEILKKHCGLRLEDSWLTEGLADFVYDAMDEHTKQEAIGFAKWFFDYKKKRMDEAPTKIGFSYWVNKPIEEYYELYLIEKEKE